MAPKTITGKINESPSQLADSSELRSHATICREISEILKPTGHVCYIASLGTAVREGDKGENKSYAVSISEKTVRRTYYGRIGMEAYFYVS